MQKVSYALVIVVMAIAFLSACKSNNENPYPTEELTEADNLLPENSGIAFFAANDENPYLTEEITDTESLLYDNGELESFSKTPHFNNANGWLVQEDCFFTILTTRYRGEMVIASADGSHGGGGLFYVDYFNFASFPPRFNPVPFDFSHYIPRYVFRDGVRTLAYVTARPHIPIGFFELNGEYFVVTRTSGMDRFEVGAIGRLVRSEVVVLYNDGSPTQFTRGEWHAEKHLVLPGAPYAILLDSERLYIATLRQILLVYKDEVIVLAEDIPFGSNLPNAMEKIGDTLFVRTRRDVWAFDVKTSELTLIER